MATAKQKAIEQLIAKLEEDRKLALRAVRQNTFDMRMLMGRQQVAKRKVGEIQDLLSALRGKK
jgi:hypothetical protein